MASFRTGFKIFGEISLKQGLGRIRSFSEDRKPRQWLPEDQWAVRQPGSTCRDPKAKPLKPSKPSRSWLSVCKDPPGPPIECDVRHNNCPPPPVKVKEDGPWFSLDNFVPKKKSEKPPPLRSCREEMKRRELFGEEEKVCEKMVPKNLVLDIKPDPEPEEICTSRHPLGPAPVVSLSVPLPKDLDIMLWCGKPSKETKRIAAQCQTDKLPYREFRPQKRWKPPPFSLPCKNDPAPSQSSFCITGTVAFSEFKQIDLPKPLYTRYKSVDLQGSSSMLSMIEVKCPKNEAVHSLAITPTPCSCPLPPPSASDMKPCLLKKSHEICNEKPFIQVGSSKPVRIKKAPKFSFRPKPTKLIEKRVSKNPCADHKKCNLTQLFRTPKKEEDEDDECPPSKSAIPESEPPKVLTGTLTDEPQIYERKTSVANDPPKWMYCLSKPGSNVTPLVPTCPEIPKEPDWCAETDGLKFYDGNDKDIHPKPPPDPYEPPPCVRNFDCNVQATTTSQKETKDPMADFRDRFVLMPEKYKIKKRPEDPTAKEQEPYTFEKFIEDKTSATKNLKLYKVKENILYDLQRLCPHKPFCPTKINLPCRKPPDSDCPQPTRFYRRFSTFTSSSLRHRGPLSIFNVMRRFECGDTTGKCKVTKLVPKERDCPDKKKPPDCAAIALPCCSKPRIPPNCDFRKTMPLCKKKLAPKPSFSECSRPPLPCPKITECDCWERKPKNDKNGRK